MQIFFNLTPTFAAHHEKSFVPDFFIGTGSWFSACLLIKLLFSNLLLIPSVNNPTQMYLSLFRVYFKVEVYFRVTWSRMEEFIDEFIVGPKVLFHAGVSITTECYFALEGQLLFFQKEEATSLNNVVNKKYIITSEWRRNYVFS